MDSILKVNNLHVHYVTDDEVVKAVNGISFELNRGESLGLVGETGAGKTTTALSIMQLVPDPPGLITEGEIIFEGKSCSLVAAELHTTRQYVNRIKNKWLEQIKSKIFTEGGERNK